MPSLQLRHIDRYLWELGHHANLIPKIRKLEIFSSSEGRVKKREVRPESRPSIQILWDLTVPAGGRHTPRFYVLKTRVGVYGLPCEDAEYPAVSALQIQNSASFSRDSLFEKCLEVIDEFYTLDPSRELSCAQWKAALKSDTVQGLLAMLLFILPNLKELYIGAAWLMDFPMFSELTPEDLLYSPGEWRHDWMGEILTTLKEKLEVLEFPAGSEGMRFQRRSSAIFDFRSFKMLRYISVPMHALQWCWRGTTPDPADVFPPTLELLRISECASRTANFMNELCLSKKKGFFPNLRCVELYFLLDKDIVAKLCESARRPDITQDVRNMCISADLELYIFFPARGYQLTTEGWGSTPWTLLEDVWYGRPYAQRWDADGDVVMAEYTRRKHLADLAYETHQSADDL
jgi:hypothetical protein